MTKLLSTLIIVLLAQVAFSQNQKDSLSRFQELKNEVKMGKARHKFLQEDFKGALEIYKEIYIDEPQNPALHTAMGQSYLRLKNYDKAQEHLENALKLGPETEKDAAFYLGQVYHRTGQLDKSVTAFEEFLRTANPKKEEYADAINFKAQCTTAKELMASPVNVKITNIGPAINSHFDDYAPSVSADGKTLIFTSRRPETKGGGIETSDMKFYEDIYISEWNPEKSVWNNAMPIAGKLNTEGHDASLSLSPDGNQIFLYKNTSETKSGDIWVSKKASSGKWSSPRPLPSQINSSYFESSASLSADGNYLYFVSERRGGIGLGDIYRCKKISKQEWGEPENLGALINTPEDEIAVFIHPDGKTLFFSSKGHNTMGGYDIFKSTYEKGEWSKPVNIGYPLNTLDDDLHFTLSADNKTAYYTSRIPGGFGENDIYQIDMSGYSLFPGEVKSNPEGLSILKGNVINSDAGQAMETTVFVFDGQGKKVAETQTNESGEFFFTLAGGHVYNLGISESGFETKRIKVTLPFDDKQIYTLVKHLLIDKKTKEIIEKN